MAVPTQGGYPCPHFAVTNYASLASGLKTLIQGFPDGSVVKNLPANTGDMDSTSDQGRSHMPQGNQAHAPQLLSLFSRAGEPQLLSPHASATEAWVPWSPCSTREATAMRSPSTATREQPLLVAAREKQESNKDPEQPKI